MATEERVSGPKFKRAGMSARLNDLRSNMNFRFNIVFGLLIAILGVGVTLLGIGVTVLLRM